MSNWTDISLRAIASAHAAMPDSISFSERKRLIRATYPFGERRYHPYKIWCREQKKYLARYDPHNAPEHLFQPSEDGLAP